MKIEELVKLKPETVRKDPELMPLYIKYYTEAFNIAPDCAGCTFSVDFKKLKKLVLTGAAIGATSATILTDMASKKYVLKAAHKNEILTYRGKNNRPVRTYGYGITDDFAKAFLTEGNKKQLEERAKMFDVIDGKPQSKKAEKALAEAKKAEKAKKAQDKALAEAAKKNLAEEQEEAKKKAEEGGDAGSGEGGDAGTGEGGDAGTGEGGDAGTGEGGDATKPEPGSPMYDPKVVKYMGEAKVDELLADNMLEVASYPDLKAKKEALVALKN